MTITILERRRVNVDRITPEQLQAASVEPDLNEALFTLQQTARINPGDVASVVFAGPKESAWPSATPEQRMTWLTEYLETERWMNCADCSEIDVRPDGMYVYEHEEEVEGMHVVVTDETGTAAPKNPGAQQLLFRFYGGDELLASLRFASIEEMDRWHEKFVGYSAIEDSPELQDMVRVAPDIAAADFIGAICTQGMFRIAAGDSIDLEQE